MTVALKKQASVLIAKLKPSQRIELADLLYTSVSGSHPAIRIWTRLGKRKLTGGWTNMNPARSKRFPPPKSTAKSAAA